MSTVPAWPTTSSRAISRFVRPEDTSRRTSSSRRVSPPHSRSRRARLPRRRGLDRLTELGEELRRTHREGSRPQLAEDPVGVYNVCDAELALTRSDECPPGPHLRQSEVEGRLDLLDQAERTGELLGRLLEIAVEQTDLADRVRQRTEGVGAPEPRRDRRQRVGAGTDPLCVLLLGEEGDRPAEGRRAVVRVSRRQLRRAEQLEVAIGRRATSPSSSSASASPWRPSRCGGPKRDACRALGPRRGAAVRSPV